MDGDRMRRAFSSVAVAIDELQDAGLWTLSDSEAMDCTRECFTQLQRLESVYAALAADLDGRDLPDGLTGKAFLRSALHRTSGQAGSDTRAVTNLLPKCTAAFQAGQVSRAHLDVITKTLEQIPRDTRYREVPRHLPELAGDNDESVTLLEAFDTYFARWARECNSTQIQYLAKALLAAIAPDADDGFDENAHERRSAMHARDDHGMLWGQMHLDAADGAAFAAAIDHFSAPNPTRKETAADGTTIEVKDGRTPAQRRADAIGLMARLAMGAAEAGTKGGEPPRIVLYTGIEDYADTHCTDPSHNHATPERRAPEPRAPEPRAPEARAPEPGAPEPRAEAQDDRRSSGTRDAGLLRGHTHGATDTHLGAIGPRLLARFSCDAVLQVALMRPTGAVLDLGRDARTVSSAQRRALTARDRGCVIPGCSAPASWCDGHHVTWWEKGGLTNLDNLALLCGQHHTAVHLGLWTLKMINGIPWAQAAWSRDPRRRWVRNTFYDDLDTARDLGAQMRLDLPDHDHPDHDHPDHDHPDHDHPDHDHPDHDHPDHDHPDHEPREPEPPGPAVDDGGQGDGG